MSSLNIINTTEITEIEKVATETGLSQSFKRKRRTTRLRGATTQVCKYFKKGKCTKGDGCSFSHEDSHTQRLKCDQNRKSIAEDDIAEEEAVEAVVDTEVECRNSDFDQHLIDTHSAQNFSKWIKMEVETWSAAGKKSWAEMSDSEDEGVVCAIKSLSKAAVKVSWSELADETDDASTSCGSASD